MDSRRRKSPERMPNSFSTFVGHPVRNFLEHLKKSKIFPEISKNVIDISMNFVDISMIFRELFEIS